MMKVEKMRSILPKNKVVLIVWCVLLLSIACKGQTDTSYLQYDILPVEIEANRTYETGAVKLERTHFLTYAGAMDDPSRLLHKHPGISTINDQSNFISFEGFAPQYHRWQMYGAQILNPNHLGNAGTINDLPSRTSGGVNMLSGQVIGSLDFHGNPSTKSMNSLAATSDVRMRNAYQNNISTNLSLIGLEAGIDRVSTDKKKNFIANYRYSTVGILTGLGLDFGGERIDYQDLTTKYEINLGKEHSISFYASLGTDNNEKDAINIDSIPSTIKDLRNVDYTSTTLIAGVSKKKKEDGISHLTTLNYSYRNIERASNQSFPTHPELSEPVSTSYQNREHLISGLVDYGVDLSKFSTTIRLLADFHSIQLDNNLPPNIELLIEEGNFISENDYQYYNILPTIDLSYAIMKGLNVTGGLSYNYNSLGGSGVFLPALKLSYDYEGISLVASYGKSAQKYDPEILMYLEMDHIESDNIAISASYEGFSARLFSHSVSNIPFAQNLHFFSAMDNLDYLPLDNNLGFSGISLNENGTKKITGVSINIEERIAGIDILANGTLMNSNDISAYDFKHIYNFMLSKKWNLSTNKQLGISASIHRRGGSYESVIDQNRSFDWGYTTYNPDRAYEIKLEDYQRADFRIFYRKNKGNGKFATLSLDIQNITNRENDAYYYYNPLSGNAELEKQLGMIPVLSWRVNW